MQPNFLPHLKQMVALAQEAIKDTTLTQETGIVNSKGQRSIGMDVHIETLLVNYIKENKLPFNIFSEEVGTIVLHEKQEYLIAFDPLDGSTNYKVGKNLLPYGLLIAVYKGEKPQLKDIVAAAGIEYTRNLSWFFDGEKTVDAQGQQINIKEDWIISKSTPVYLDLYYKDCYQLYSALPQQVFVRNSGSTAGNLSYVLANVGAALGGICMRGEEIGTVYALIKGAGGAVVNYNGTDLGEIFFDPETTYPILAGAKSVVKFVISRIKSK